MKHLLSYTVSGDEYYAEVNNSLHLALSDDGKNYAALRNNTGVLFCKAEYDGVHYKGITKFMLSPWIFAAERGYALAYIRHTKNGADLNEDVNPQKKRGYICVSFTDDFISFSEPVYSGLSDGEIFSVRVKYDGAYLVEWTEDGGVYSAKTKDFVNFAEKKKIAEYTVSAAKAEGIENAVPCADIEIPDSLADKLIIRYGRIYCVGVKPMEISVKAGERPTLPKAEFIYNDGSTHLKPVFWDDVDFSKKGEYTVKGRVKQEIYPFPFIERHISDPCVVLYNGRYYLTHTGDTKVILRAANSIQGLRTAKEITLYEFKDKSLHNLWAQELHIINGVPYIFTTVGKKEWFTVKSHVLICKGDIENPADWGEPVPVVRKDGTELNPCGISLDMTYFEDGEKSYVMWSNRIMREFNGGVNPGFEPADIYIATVNKEKPWVLTSDPVCVIRPMYGWDRLQTEVDEGPYLLRRGDDLFVSISGSSTEVDVLYCLGLLKTKSGADLLDPAAWEWLNYPVLTKESVKGEYGPGHNSFVKSEDGDDLIVYHAVPLDENGKSLTRHMAVRRVHWKSDGLPYFEMTAEEDVPARYKTVTCKVTVE